MTIGANIFSKTSIVIFIIALLNFSYSCLAEKSTGNEEPVIADPSMPSWCEPWSKTDDTPLSSLFTTMERSQDGSTVPFRTFKNLYWTSYRFFSLVPSKVADPAAAKFAYNDSNRPDLGVSVNSISVPLPVHEDNIYSFIHNLRICRLKGTTLHLDFPFTSMPDHHGFWAELVLPVFSLMRHREASRKARGELEVMSFQSNEEVQKLIKEVAAEGMRSPGSRSLKLGAKIDRVLLTNLRRPLSAYFVHMLTLALSPEVPPPLESQARGFALEDGSRGGGFHIAAYKVGVYYIPEIVDTEDTNHVYQIPLGWLAVDELIAVNDRYTNPEYKTGFMGVEPGDIWVGSGSERYVRPDHRQGFWTKEDGKEFRRRAYKMVGLPPPVPWTPGQPPVLPRLLTLLLEDFTGDWRPQQLVNAPELLMALREVAAEFGMEARVVTVTLDAPFPVHVRAMAESAVLVARHGPLMASSIFLPPGAVAVELLPYKVEWQGLSQTHRNMTRSVGDLHHFAWRANEVQHCVYDKAGIKYASWPAADCNMRECLAAQRRAGLRVDVVAVAALVHAKLGMALEGKLTIAEAAEPWPKMK